MLNFLTTLANITEFRQPILPEMFRRDPLSNVNIDAYFPGCIVSNSNDPNDSPTCLRRIKVNGLRSTPAFHDFVANTEPEISCDPEARKKLIANIKYANYSTEVLEDSELPYLTLAALAKDEIPKETAADLLFWHQGMKDEELVKVSLLFNDQGSTVGYLYEEEIALIKQLPLSQQVYAKMKARPPTFSLNAMRVQLFIEKRREVAFEPRLGIFTKDDIATAEIEKRSRLVSIAFPGVPNYYPDFFESHTDFTIHDFFHVRTLHVFLPNLIDSMREILSEFRSTGIVNSKERWKIADFATPVFEEDIHKALDQFLREVLEDGSNSDMGWFIALHVRANSARWQSQYGISINQIPLFDQMNAMIDKAEPLLQNLPIIEQIHYLQEQPTIC